MSKDRCDCYIGTINGYEPLDLTLSNYVSIIESETESTNMAREFFDKNPLRKDKKGPVSPMDFLDRRKGHSSLFNYCPSCGEKVKWDVLKFNLKLKLKIK